MRSDAAAAALWWWWYQRRQSQFLARTRVLVCACHKKLKTPLNKSIRFIRRHTRTARTRTMAEFVDAVNQLEQLEEGGGDARTVLGPRVIGLTSPGGSEIGSDAEDSASSEILEGGEGGDDEDESSSSSSG